MTIRPFQGSRALRWALAVSASSLLSMAGTAVAGSPLGGEPSSTAPSASLVLTGAAIDDAALPALVAARFGPEARPGLDADGRLHALRRLAVKVPAGTDPATVAAHLFVAHRDLFGLGGHDAGAVALAPAGRETLAGGAGVVLRFDVTVAGVPMERRSATARLRGDGTLAELRVDPLPRRVSLAASPITADAARARVAARFGLTEVGRPTAVIAVASPEEGRLAWRVPVALIPLVSHHLVWVDAATGGILGTSQAGFDQPHLPLVPVQNP